MRRTRIFMLTLLVTVVLLPVGCTDRQEGGPAGDQHNHHHETGPNGAELLEIDDGGGHIEVLPTHDDGVMIMWSLDDQSPTPKPRKLDGPPIFKSQHQGQDVVITGVEFPDGGADAWRFDHVLFRDQFEGGTFDLKVGGKSHTVTWEHHDH
ncbi:MAG: hypothetical protein CMJ83_18590 [Planctomycetes bacterium]|nr:hypothetical protein [Planctomycetota bacterium]